jgi:cytoskeletal protein RodZ
MELKPESTLVDNVPPEPIITPAVSPVSEPQVEPKVASKAEVSESRTTSTLKTSSNAKPIQNDDQDHKVDRDSTSDSIQRTSPIIDSSVSSGSPMSTSSLPLSSQASSTQIPTNAQRPGERLRQARLLKNRELKDIAVDLNINERILTAIEADDYKSLPEPAFIRGYLRSYGRLLGIDSDALIVQFNEIYTSATGLSSNHSLENSPIQQLAKLQTRSRKSKRWMWWLLVPVALVVLFMLLTPLVKKMMGSSTSDSTVAKTTELADSAQFAASTTNSALPQVTSTPLAGLPPIATSQSSSDQLVLTLSKASNVFVQDSTGKTLVSGSQGTDTPLTLTGSSPFSITLSDAASVNLSLNNEHIDLNPYTVDGHASFRLSR